MTYFCSECQKEFGSCSLFITYELQVGCLKSTSLRSSSVAPNPDQNKAAALDKPDDVKHEFLLPGSVCVIAADEKSTDTAWLVKIFEETVAKDNISDHYGHVVLDGQRYIDGRYLEFHITKQNNHIFIEMLKKMFFYRSSVVYPFVNHEQKENIYTISNNDFCDIIAYVEHFGMKQL